MQSKASGLLLHGHILSRQWHFQLGLPILIIREEGVLADGMLERGVAGLYMPEFNLDKPVDEYFNSVEWRGVIQKWEGYVRYVLEKKGRPQPLF